MIGLEAWFANFSQISSRWITAQSLADIPRPHVEYAIFATFKAAEVMSVIGGLVAHPLYRWYLSRKLNPKLMTPNSEKIIKNACRKLQGRFLIAGLITAPFLSRLETHLSGTTDSELKNRCYSIRCNAETLSLDRAVLVCGFIGWYWRRFQGAVDGVNIGIAYAMVNSQFIAPRTSPVLKNSIDESERFETVEEMEESKTKLNKFLAEQDRKDAEVKVLDVKD
ncbi:transcellular chaperone signaling (x)cross tissue [Caenorhabditis elegans]|uniref:Transcellular chaperone signaling (X)cross tissue n=1 Tax=Caenorhabditis elegans TaxID=6239 RepID=H2L073_CAEEL|nr:transcellular chaperone signaling (x)cross tissue [Caenorhabditis elegans]CCD71774.1 transcellular chaperone signaling (x)cross tissue [Caenorhabditis elegans]|eukprot:NP_001123059.1 Uncharacterized protein CELE_Y61A9LA.11 [Caenorhabditis elegans]